MVYSTSRRWCIGELESVKPILCPTFPGPAVLTWAVWRPAWICFLYGPGWEIRKETGPGPPPRALPTQLHLDGFCQKERKKEKKLHLTGKEDTELDGHSV
jgi:hypothetical protein